MSEDFSSLLETLAAPERGPVGIAAAAAGMALGLALIERVLAHPAADATPGQAAPAREMARSIRKRLSDVIAADLAASRAIEAIYAAGDADLDARLAAPRVPAYRAARRLIDAAIQALTLMTPVFASGNHALVADLETAWRLIGVALEAGIAACEQHLQGLSSFFAEAERPALLEQASQGREWAERAHAELAWRLGRR